MNIVWEEKNYIERKTNCLTSSGNVPSGSMSATGSDLITNEWNVTGNLKLCYNGETGEYVGESPSHVIYLWTEKRNGVEYPCYAGQTQWKVHKRIKDHLIYDDPFLFQRKLRKRPVLYKCYVVVQESNLDKLGELETKYILEHNTFHDYNENGYNLLLGTKNHTVSEVVRKKISRKLRGKNHPMYGKTMARKSVEMTRKSKTGWFDRLTENERDDFRKKCSIASKKKIRTKRWCKNISAGQRGRIFSDETKKKMSDAKPAGKSGIRDIIFRKDRDKWLVRIKDGQKYKSLGLYLELEYAKKRLLEYQNGKH
jgi:hypothetical protein